MTRALGAAGALLFLFGAAVQVNDPDPLRWIAIYLAASAVCALQLAGRLEWPAAAAVALAALAWMALLAPRALDVPAARMFEAWEMQDVAVEEAREAGGLLLIALCTGALALLAWRRPPPARRLRFEFATTLAAPAATVWAHALTLEGVNAELMPLARMTAPAGVERIDPARAPRGQRLFRSWILFLGVLPVDYDDIGLAEFEPGRRFLERSRMLTQRLWQHERTVEAAGAGCRVTDRVEFEPRLALAAPLQGAVFRAAFALRHRNLRRRFGAA